MQAHETAPGTGAPSAIKVVDLSCVLAGPLCTQILSDHGARVIKIEMPDGDETGAYFIGINHNRNCNRNKRELVLESHPARVARDTGPPA